MEMMELEDAFVEFEPQIDRRRKVPEPPPVQLLAVADVALPGIAGLEKELDAFYVELLRLERDAATHEIVYRAENFRLRFDVHECPQPREDMRAIGIAVPSLAEMVGKLTDLEVELIRQRGITPAQDTLLLRDPAGNWIELSEMRRVS
jgi:hypothetical protein